MGADILFQKGVIDEIVTRSDMVDTEVCGLLLGDADTVSSAVHCANVAADPGTAFEINPAQLIAAHKASRAGGSRIVGCYHSHPNSGAPLPSPRDAAEAAPNGWLWLIAAGRGVGLYRAVEGGRWHGRFEPVPYAIEE